VIVDDKLFDDKKDQEARMGVNRTERMCEIVKNGTSATDSCFIYLPRKNLNIPVLRTEIAKRNGRVKSFARINLHFGGRSGRQLNFSSRQRKFTMGQMCVCGGVFP
jgi:hypothetical protein